MLQRAPARERAMVLRSLGVMFNSGCSLSQSLNMLAEQTSHPSMAEACRHLFRQVNSGHYLSSAMQKIPWAFTRLQVKMIQVGESSGKLGAVLVKLAEQEDRQIELALKIQNALTMPLIICTMCLLMVLLGPPLLFQSLFEFLADTGGELPWPTRLLMAASAMLRSPLCWAAGLALAAGLAMAFRRYRGSPRLFEQLLRVPALGTVLKLLVLTRFARSLQTMLEVGMTLIPSLTMSAEACDCPYLENEVVHVIARLKEGDSLADAFGLVEMLPPAFVQAVAAGEESGSLTKMLNSLAHLYQVELDHALEMLTRSLEPLILAVVGSIVGFVVVATLFPMLKLVESL